MNIQTICPVHTPAIYDAAVELADFIDNRAAATFARYGFGFRADDNGPDSWDELIAAYCRSIATREPLPVYSGATATSIYSTIQRAHVNLQFRYWHDMEHVRIGEAFTFECERIVSAHHMADATRAGLSPLALRLLDADTFGQLLFGREHGGFVEDQSRFAIDYVTRGYDEAAAGQLAIRNGRTAEPVDPSRPCYITDDAVRAAVRDQRPADRP